jgi:hypothetical protein
MVGQTGPAIGYFISNMNDILHSRSDVQIYQARLIRWLLLATILGVLAGGSPAPATAQDTARFWYDISLGGTLVDWYNQIARPGDIARAENLTQLGLLDRVQIGRRLLVFKSATNAEEAAAQLPGRVDILGYNLEHGPLNPLEEQNDPLAAILRMRALADQYDMQLAMGPDRRFAESHGPALAPYVDIFVLQVQRAQTDPQSVYDFIVPLVGRLRRANPDLEISVQIRTEGDVVALGDLVVALRPFLDGVSILTSPDTTAIAADLVGELNRRNLDDPSLYAAVELPLPADYRPELNTTGVEPRPPDRLPKTGVKSTTTGVMVRLKDVAAAVAGALGGEVLPTDPSFK